MGALTLSEIRTRILFRAHGTANLFDPGNSEATGISNLNGLIASWKDQTIAAHDFVWKKGNATLTLADNKPEVDMPPDFQAPIAFYHSSNSLTPLSLGEFRRRFASSEDSTGTTTYYIPLGAVNGRHRFKFYPITADTLRVDYVRAFPDLEKDTDTLELKCGIPAGAVPLFQNALIEGVLSDVFEYQNDDAKSTKALAKWRGYVDALAEEEQDRGGVQELASFGDYRFPRPRLPNAYGDLGLR